MDKSKLLKDMLLPDGDSSHSLSIAFAARSGSGKTTLLTSLVNDARKLKEFKETRFIYVGIKRDSMFEAPAVSNIDDMWKQLAKNPIVNFFPSDPAFYEVDIDEIIESTFDNAESSEGGFVLILDDINVVKGFDSRGSPSPAVKKLAIAGRSMGIRGVFVTHRIANLPRIMNGNTSALVMLSISEMDIDYGKKIFGIDFTNLIPELKDYRWAYVDLINEDIHQFEPIGGN
jgi:Cdc6-like AAA superfamily ATPase